MGYISASYHTGSGVGGFKVSVKVGELLAVGRWFPPGAPVSSTHENWHHYHLNHRPDMTLAVTEELNPNKPNLDMTLAVTEALNPNKPNLDMTLAVTEVLSPNKPNLDITWLLLRR